MTANKKQNLLYLINERTLQTKKRPQKSRRRNAKKRRHPALKKIVLAKKRQFSHQRQGCDKKQQLFLCEKLQHMRLR